MKSQFLTTLDQLQANHDISVCHIYIGDPASESEINAIEEKIQSRLPDAIREFYKAHNGFQVMWIDKKSEDYFPEIHDKLTTNRLNEQEFHISEEYMTGSMNMLPVSEVFSKNALESYHIREPQKIET